MSPQIVEVSPPAAAPESASYFIGWDVGGWNCDKNPASRDAIVILDADRHIVGAPWRGNLRSSIAAARTVSEWVERLFVLCNAEPSKAPMSVTMAIDAPLGFPESFVALIAERKFADPGKASAVNQYLFRETERRLFTAGRTPLSAIKDMIGSQATKAMHALARFGLRMESCGVWTDGNGFRAIETYPAACCDTAAIKTLLNGKDQLKPADKEDARTCALIAYLFTMHRAELHAPDSIVPSSEGWIWVP